MYCSAAREMIRLQLAKEPTTFSQKTIRSGRRVNPGQVSQIPVCLETSDISARVLTDTLLRTYFGKGLNDDAFTTDQVNLRSVGLWSFARRSGHQELWYPNKRQDKVYQLLGCRCERKIREQWCFDRNRDLGFIHRIHSGSFHETLLLERDWLCARL
jgi:hypothetical protein